MANRAVHTSPNQLIVWPVSVVDQPEVGLNMSRQTRSIANDGMA